MKSAEQIAEEIAKELCKEIQDELDSQDFYPAFTCLRLSRKVAQAITAERERAKVLLEMLESSLTDFEVIGEWGLSDCVDAGDCRWKASQIKTAINQYKGEMGWL